MLKELNTTLSILHGNQFIVSLTNTGKNLSYIIKQRKCLRQIAKWLFFLSI